MFIGLTFRLQAQVTHMVLISRGGHHGYYRNIPKMHTSFIVEEAGINKCREMQRLSEPDITQLIARLLGIIFDTPDGKAVPEIIKANQ